MTRDIDQLVLDLNKKKSSVNNNDQLENFVNDHITVNAKTPNQKTRNNMDQAKYHSTQPVKP